MSKKFYISIITLSFFSVFILAPFYVQAQQTGFTVNFDVQPGVQPKILPSDGRLSIRLIATINLVQYGAYCEDNNVSSFQSTILKDNNNLPDQFFIEPRTKTYSFERNATTVSKTINDTLTADSGRVSSENRIYARIECPNGTNVTESSRVLVLAGSGGPVPGPGGPVPGPGGPVPGQPQTVTFNIPNPIAAESLVDLAKAIGRFLFQIAIPIAVIIIIYAGLLFLTSGGDKEKVIKARKALWYAVIGLAIILIGQGFFTLIKSILNLGGPTP